MREPRDTSDKVRKPSGPEDERRKATEANIEMDRKFKQGDGDDVPHADKVGGLRGNPS